MRGIIQKNTIIPIFTVDVTNGAFHERWLRAPRQL